MTCDEFETLKMQTLDSHPSKSRFSQLGRSAAPAGRNGLLLQEKIRETLYQQRSKLEGDNEESGDDEPVNPL